MKLRCSRCRKLKPKSDFYKRKDRPKGYFSECKQCMTERNIKNYMDKKNSSYRPHWGRKEWIVKYWLNKMANPFPERYSIRQAFYTELPTITSVVPENVKEDTTWAKYFYNAMVRILSNLVLEGKASYRTINVYDDSGSSLFIWQNKKECLKYGERLEPDYPIEVWVENNASYNSLTPLLDNFQINFLSQKGFAKTQQIETMMLDRLENVEVILNLTDFDASGYYMPTDLQSRLDRYTSNWLETKPITVKHIGIFPSQIPQNRKAISLMPLNKKDSRYNFFMEKFRYDPLIKQGYGYEIQALNPSEIRDLVSNAINEAINEVD